ncbi:carboxypeptidase regulatory-like domain-containing protein [Gimesia aquarii]|uniref:Carboxypeptidase regulatory-like domain-containing protein n=1 Tax=Gimesia aquarii TaxID=2527964 RepID=A0A517X2D9_9PLAN|nr:carboxypeptidase regulatory-like domain-containing protein [Gimesia aquarii]QDU11666.1 hypothetical protein V202x_50900 [Gimesia aquarii]
MTRMMLLAALSIMVVMSVGCSDRAPDMPELGRVHGTITLDGKPLPDVTIYFEPEKGRPSTAKANPDGFYEAFYLIDAKGVKIGPCSVRVEWGIDDSGPAIPVKYGIKSELSLNVKPGDNTYDIEMKSS